MMFDDGFCPESGETAGREGIAGEENPFSSISDRINARLRARAASWEGRTERDFIFSAPLCRKFPRPHQRKKPIGSFFWRRLARNRQSLTLLAGLLWRTQILNGRRVHLVYPAMKYLWAAMIVIVGSSALAAVVAPKLENTAAREASAQKFPVTLVSDGETWVSVAHVLMPARFQTKQLQLPAGEYEVIGRRRYHRDERRVIQVGGREPQTVTVICTVTSKS